MTEQGTGSKEQGKKRVRWSGFGRGEAEDIALPAKVREDLNSKGDLAALDALVDLLDEACGEFAVGVERAEFLSHAAEIARCEAQPAAGFPIFSVEAGERDFVELGEIFGECRVDAPGDDGRNSAEVEFRFLSFVDQECLMVGRNAQVAAQEIGRDAALVHFTVNF